MKKEISNQMNIKELPVDIKAKLSVDVRKNLSEIIEKEFKNRIDIDYNSKNEKKKEIIEKHRRRLGVDKLISEAKQKKAEMEEIASKLRMLGFSDGNYNFHKEVHEELQSLDKGSQEIMTIKHKLQTRLSLSTTVGEATVIMHEILGNTLIPSLTKNAITFKENP